jgi:hypothetical protein
VNFLSDEEKMSEESGKRLARLVADAFNRWKEEADKEPCAWCTLTRGEHVEEDLGHNWVSLEMDILINASNRKMKFSKQLPWRVKKK